ncbi:MAG: zinc ribbon domain-containing protein [Chloroflexi bacterium]|nr:zinc ribbon domain-containing protein [Chloroflexota bacterium]MBI4198198.1 zinc ribbon domain-containing protein [Chloroflexota bacterium]
MPIYEYVCPNCTEKFEKLRPMSDGRSAPCPRCSGESPRVLSVFTAISASPGGEMQTFAGGGCACAAGGACACAGEA